ELLECQALLVGVRLGRRVGGAERGAQRQGIAEVDVDVAEAALYRAHDLQEPAEALALLPAAALLRDVVAHVLDLGVRYRYRNEKDVLRLAAAISVDDVGEEAEPGRQQLARARAPTLDVPFQRETLLDQIVDVLAQHELVDRVVLEGSADEEHATAPEE